MWTCHHYGFESTYKELKPRLKELQREAIKAGFESTYKELKQLVYSDLETASAVF